MITTRELHRRIAAARGEVAAMLFFALPPKGTKVSKRYSNASYARDQHIRGLVGLLDILMGGPFETVEGDCGACGKPIRGGQRIVRTEDAGNFHASAKCWGKDIPKRFVYRAETQRDADADARKRLKDGRAYLKARGMLA